MLSGSTLWLVALMQYSKSCTNACASGRVREEFMTCRALCMQSPEKNMAAEMISAVYDERRMPNFLANVAPEAEVHSGFLDILDSFQQEQGGREPLAETVKELTGGPLVCLHT